MPRAAKEKPIWLRLKGENRGSADLLRNFGILTPAVPIFRLAELLDVKLHWVNEPGWEGAVTANSELAEIWVRAEAPVVRQRFTVAHELGHLMLHRSNEVHFRDVSPATTMHPPEERDANAFAAALLMPRFMLQPLIYNSGLPVNQLAAMFEVSTAAMEARIDWFCKGRRDP